MRMQLVYWELKKLCAVPMFWVFVILCIGFNSLLIVSDNYDSDYISYVTGITENIDGQMGNDFDIKLAKLPDSEYKDLLISHTYGATDILEGYDTTAIGDYYISSFRITGAAATLVESKFEKLQTGANALADIDASQSLAAGDMTQTVYNSLFHTLCRAVVAEGMILAVLAALYSSGCESLSHTAASVYSSKTGRKIQKCKLAASAALSLAAYGMIAAVSVGIFALLWKLGPIWGAGMSSQFYTIIASGISTPFISWIPFTVGGYLVAVLMLGAAVVLIFHLLGFGAGILTGNMYSGFLMVFLLVAFEFSALMLFGDTGNWLMYQIAYWTPIPLWLELNLWFTGLGFSAIIPYQECWTALLWLLLLIIINFILYLRFLRKDVNENAA